MAIDRLLADACRLADPLDAGALIAMRDEFPPPDREQMVEPAGRRLVLYRGGCKMCGDGFRNLVAARSYSLARPARPAALVQAVYGLKAIKRYDTV
jgi:hypothetical protein